MHQLAPETLEGMQGIMQGVDTRRSSQPRYVQRIAHHLAGSTKTELQLLWRRVDVIEMI